MEFNLESPDAYASLRINNFRRFIIARFLLTFAIQMQSVIVGWQVYALTHDALSLGLIGIAEVVPFFCVALFAGHAADIINRKKIIQASNLVYFICAATLFLISTSFRPILSTFGVIPIYLVIFITGIARGFMSPAQTAFAAQLVPRELFGNASTWSSIAWQTAEITGPAIGGLVYGFFGIGSAYSLVIIFSAMGLTFYSFIKNQPLPERNKQENIWQSLSAGIKFVFENQVLLSAITLDMFAVFFGGVLCVLPIFADQVFHTGAKGLGFLRAAPAAGAITMSVIQTHWPLFKKAGRNLFIGVFIFGVSIIMFAFSKNFYLALIILMIGGMADNISVVIRATIIQLYTPNEMRGRVASVNGIFIGSSNELGSFESGLAAKLMGLIPSVIFGGSMTIATVAAVRKFAPILRKLKM
ncbi:MAG: MFS transporter [Ignavibacteriaceae bacterium]|nr:MFS transporter [Ignavibacteriaceae bacterium]